MGFLPLPIGWFSFLFYPGLAGLLIIVGGIGAKHAVALCQRRVVRANLSSFEGDSTRQ
jgi:hypothetical protein